MKSKFLSALMVLFAAGCVEVVPNPHDPDRCHQAPEGCDIDGDGVTGVRTGGTDCDDGESCLDIEDYDTYMSCLEAAAEIHPGATEALDGLDNDCDGIVD